MIMTIDKYMVKSPEDYGLPSESELQSRLSAYFPEYAEQRTMGSNTISATLNPNKAEKFNSGHAQAFINGLSIDKIRADFPILSERIEGKPLIWMDNAATTQRPRQVIDRLAYYYEHENSNIHRGAHSLAEHSTDAYEEARFKTARFINAPSAKNIVFVRGTTEGLNLIANSFVKPMLRPGDEIILTVLEHHANIVPWQMIAQETGAILRVASVDNTGQVILSEFMSLLGPKTKFASITHVSNALGTITPIADIINAAHRWGVPVCVDGAQSIPHIQVDVTAMDADFFVFSGHKIYGPTGIGVVYGKKELLDQAQPYQGGGNMISDVTFERTKYQQAPQKFEAGTASIADAIGLGAALDYVNLIGIENISMYEQSLLSYGTNKLSKIQGLQLIGSAYQKACVFSFIIKNAKTEEIGRYLNESGIAVRAGHHCAQPILRRFGLESTVRASLCFYNTFAELDYLAERLESFTHMRYITGL